jgi:hypothetical protein
VVFLNLIHATELPAGSADGLIFYLHPHAAGEMLDKHPDRFEWDGAAKIWKLKPQQKGKGQ